MLIKFHYKELLTVLILEQWLEFVKKKVSTNVRDMRLCANVIDQYPKIAEDMQNILDRIRLQESEREVAQEGQ